MSLPELKDIKDLVEGVLGRDVTIAASTGVDPAAQPGPMTGVYVDDTTKLSAVVLVDFPLCAYAGAAMGLVPPGGAQAAIEDRTLPTALQENVSEMLNILASALCDATDVHQRLYQSFGAGQQPPSDVAAWSVGGAAHRRDVRLDVKGYGAGGLSIISTVGA